MTGVEILAVEEVAVTFSVGFDWLVFWVVLAVVALLSTIIVGVGLFEELGAWSFLFGWLPGLILGMILGAAVARNNQPLEYETQYKVIISDEVKMNEFLEKYEIIDQEGKIYTVRERD